MSEDVTDSGDFQHPKLNPSILGPNKKQKIAQAFKSSSEYADSSLTVSGKPFPHCVVKDFISDTDGDEGVFLKNLCSELQNLKYNEKSNDLYKFSQSDDLVNLIQDTSCVKKMPSRKYVSHLCSLFNEKLESWMKEVTGIELKNNCISMFAAQYKYTDVLLCHDDELEDRRIAFILYLTEDWSESDGGTLDLFSVNESGSPDKIVKSLTPTYNSFVFFEVSPVSFHQVSEILSKTRTRLSISGWLHGPTLERPHRPPSPRAPAITFLPAQQNVDLLSQWIEPRYLNIATQATIQEQFEGTSEIQLPDFLLADKYKLLSESIQHLSNHNEFWDDRGPPNKRKYQSMKFDQDFELLESELPTSSKKDSKKKESKELKISLKTMEAYNLVNDFIRLFCSEEMFLYMSNVTGLSFHPMAANYDESSGTSKESNSEIPSKRQKTDANSVKDEDDSAAGMNSKCRYEIRCWSKGCYTLIRDTDSDRGVFALDVSLHCGAEGWQQESGGYTSYIAQDEDIELLTVLPSSNCLSLAYRDSEALRFVKHVNQKATKPFFDFSFVYSE